MATSMCNANCAACRLNPLAQQVAHEHACREGRFVPRAAGSTNPRLCAPVVHRAGRDTSVAAWPVHSWPHSGNTETIKKVSN